MKFESYEKARKFLPVCVSEIALKNVTIRRKKRENRESYVCAHEMTAENGRIFTFPSVQLQTFHDFLQQVISDFF